MRNLFALIGMLVVGLGGAGWYLGWYQLHVAKTPQGNLEIQTEVDTKKLTTDSGTFFQKVGKMVTEQSKQAPSSQPASTPVTTPAQPGTSRDVPQAPAAPGTQGLPPLPNIPQPQIGPSGM
jgi:hypothetical protein